MLLEGNMPCREEAFETLQKTSKDLEDASDGRERLFVLLIGRYLLMGELEIAMCGVLVADVRVRSWRTISDEPC